MSHLAPGCDFCNKFQCEHCTFQDFTTGWTGQIQDLYTWCEDAALPSPAPTEPQLLQPPALTKGKPANLFTPLEPYPTRDTLGRLEGLLSSPKSEHVTPQSLNWHRSAQRDSLVSPTIKRRIDLGLSSSSPDQVDIIDLSTRPLSLGTSSSEAVTECASPSLDPTTTIDHVLLAFDKWKLECNSKTNTSGSPKSASSPPKGEPNRSSSPQQSRKRTSDQALSSKQSGTKRPRVSSDRKPTATKEDKSLLACPFWKKNPIKHRDCFKGVKRIRDVKQHLRRSHQQPVFCPRCGMEFDGEDAVPRLTEHSRAVEQCEVSRSFVPPDGITQTQQNGLNRYSDRNADEKEQWYVIWDYIFPDGRTPRPSSPYVNQDLSEDMSSFREFSHSEGWNTLDADSDLRHVTLYLDEDMLRACLNRIYENWLAKRNATSQTSGEESPLALSDTSTPDERTPANDPTATDQIQGNNFMTLGGFVADPQLNDYWLTYQIDDQFFPSNDFAAKTSLNPVQTLPSVPLPNPAHELEHEKQQATVDPILISR